MIEEAYKLVVGTWSIPPSEFWRMHPAEFWWLVEAKQPPKKHGSLSVPELEELERMLHSED